MTDTSRATSMVPVLQTLADLSASYDTLFCDLWGCLHNGVTCFPEAVDALQAFRAGGGKVVFLTNAPRPSSDVRQSLARLGLTQASYDVVVSSGDAAQLAMFDGVIGQNVWHLGPDKDLGLFETPPEDAGSRKKIRRVEINAAEGIICTGLLDEHNETAEDYRQRLEVAQARGLPMLCANPDQVVVFGEKELPCAGSLAALYEEIGGKVQYFGKPYASIYDLARRRLAQIGAGEQSRILAIGDGIHTDVAGANRVGLDVLFITSGLAAGKFGPEDDSPSQALLAAWLDQHGQRVDFAMGRLR